MRSFKWRRHAIQQTRLLGRQQMLILRHMWLHMGLTDRPHRDRNTSLHTNACKLAAKGVGPDKDLNSTHIAIFIQNHTKVALCKI